MHSYNINKRPICRNKLDAFAFSIVKLGLVKDNYSLSANFIGNVGTKGENLILSNNRVG